MSRRQRFVSGEIYHIFNKSIAGFGIFRSRINKKRFIQSLDYYNTNNYSQRFATALKRNMYTYQSLLYPKEDSIIKFISYNIMPDHYHLEIKILKDNCLSKYINILENSYTRYFNLKYKRKGPLWQSPFKSVSVKTSEQALHLSRYIHLNPTTAGLVKKPEDWEFSSYRDYISNERILKEIMTEITIKNPEVYKKFVDDRKDYQRKLKKIKKTLLDH